MRMMEKKNQCVIYHQIHSVKPQIYLLPQVQPGDKSFGVDKLQPEVQTLMKSDGPGNLRDRQTGRGTDTI